VFRPSRQTCKTDPIAASHNQSEQIEQTINEWFVNAGVADEDERHIEM